MSDARRVFRMLNNNEAAATLSDGDLIDAVIEQVWGDLPMTEEPSSLLAEMITRFQKLAGVHETPKGATVDGEPFWPDTISEEQQ